MSKDCRESRHVLVNGIPDDWSDDKIIDHFGRYVFSFKKSVKGIPKFLKERGYVWARAGLLSSVPRNRKKYSLTQISKPYSGCIVPILWNPICPAKNAVFLKQTKYLNPKISPQN